MKKTLLLFLLVVISLAPGCKKNEKDPCEGLAWLTAPTTMGLFYLDKETGKNLFLEKKIDASKITVTPAVSMSINTVAGSEYYGAMILYIDQNKKGAFKYEINIPGIGTTTLAYTNEEVITQNACNPVRIVVGQPIVGNDPFTVERVSTEYRITITH